MFFTDKLENKHHRQGVKTVTISYNIGLILSSCLSKPMAWLFGLDLGSSPFLASVDFNLHSTLAYYTRLDSILSYSDQLFQFSPHYSSQPCQLLSQRLCGKMWNHSYSAVPREWSETDRTGLIEERSGVRPTSMGRQLRYDQTKQMHQLYEFKTYTTCRMNAHRHHRVVVAIVVRLLPVRFNQWI